MVLLRGPVLLVSVCAKKLAQKRAKWQFCANCAPFPLSGPHWPFAAGANCCLGPVCARLALSISPNWPGNRLLSLCWDALGINCTYCAASQLGPSGPIREAPDM